MHELIELIVQRPTLPLKKVTRFINLYLISHLGRCGGGSASNPCDTTITIATASSKINHATSPPIYPRLIRFPRSNFVTLLSACPVTLPHYNTLPLQSISPPPTPTLSSPQIILAQLLILIPCLAAYPQRQHLAALKWMRRPATGNTTHSGSQRTHTLLPRG